MMKILHYLLLLHVPVSSKPSMYQGNNDSAVLRLSPGILTSSSCHHLQAEVPKAARLLEPIPVEEA